MWGLTPSRTRYPHLVLEGRKPCGMGSGLWRAARSPRRAVRVAKERGPEVGPLSRELRAPRQLASHISGQPGSIPVRRPTIITTAIRVEIASNSDGSSFVIASSSRADREGNLPSISQAEVNHQTGGVPV